MHILSLSIFLSQCLSLSLSLSFSLSVSLSLETFQRHRRNPSSTEIAMGELDTEPEAATFFEIVDHTNTTDFEVFVSRISQELAQLELYSSRNVESDSFHYLVDHPLLTYFNLPHLILVKADNSTLEHAKMKSSAFQLAEWPVCPLISLPHIKFTHETPIVTWHSHPNNPSITPSSYRPPPLNLVFLFIRSFIQISGYPASIYPFMCQSHKRSRSSVSRP